MNYVDINLDLLNTDEKIITSGKLVKIIESSKNKIIKIDFMNRFEFVYDLNNEKNIGFNVLNDGLSITTYIIDNIASLIDFIEYLKGNKNHYLMSLLLNFVVADLTKSTYYHPDKELSKYLYFLKITERERVYMDEWYKECLDAQIKKIEILKTKGHTDREILDRNEFGVIALIACNLPIKSLISKIDGQDRALQQLDTHTSNEHKSEYFNDVPITNLNEIDRVLIGLLYSVGFKHLLEILPQESKKELFKLINQDNMLK